MGNKSVYKRRPKRRAAAMRSRIKTLQLTKAKTRKNASKKIQPSHQNEIKVNSFETINALLENQITHSDYKNETTIQNSTYSGSDTIDVQYHIEELQDPIESKSVVECTVENEIQFQWMEAVYGTKNKNVILCDSSQDIMPLINEDFENIENAEAEKNKHDLSQCGLKRNRILKKNILFVSNGVTFFLTDFLKK